MDITYFPIMKTGSRRIIQRVDFRTPRDLLKYPEIGDSQFEFVSCNLNISVRPKMSIFPINILKSDLLCIFKFVVLVRRVGVD